MDSVKDCDESDKSVIFVTSLSKGVRLVALVTPPLRGPLKLWLHGNRT
jgi:hypothetical protein